MFFFLLFVIIIICSSFVRSLVGAAESVRCCVGSVFFFISHSVPVNIRLKRGNRRRCRRHRRRHRHVDATATRCALIFLLSGLFYFLFSRHSWSCVLFYYYYFGVCVCIRLVLRTTFGLSYIFKRRQTLVVRSILLCYGCFWHWMSAFFYCYDYCDGVRCVFIKTYIFSSCLTLCLRIQNIRHRFCRATAQICSHTSVPASSADQSGCAYEAFVLFPLTFTRITYIHS